MISSLEIYIGDGKNIKSFTLKKIQSQSTESRFANNTVSSYDG